MKKRKKYQLIAGAILIILSFSGCKASEQAKNILEIKEQDSMIIQDTEKIYPNEIGNIAKDPIVQNSNIDGYMEKYNKNASDDAKINYTSIRYNQNGNYYYVNDSNRNLGIKFVLGDVGQIISASVYSGSTSDTGVNMIDVISAATNTFGYGYISDEDRQKISDITNQINTAQGNINSSLNLFNGSLDMSVSLQDSVSLVDIPSMTQYFTNEDTARADKEMTDKLNNEIKNNIENNKVDSLIIPEKPEDKFNYSAPSYEDSNLYNKIHLTEDDSLSDAELDSSDISDDSSSDHQTDSELQQNTSSEQDKNTSSVLAPLLATNS